MTIRTITAANSVFMLTVDQLYSSPVQLIGFGVNAAFTQGEVIHAELKLGVDANVGSGWVPALIPMKIAFLASSPSVDIFENWARTNNQGLQMLLGQGTILIPSVKKIYACSDGALSGYMPLPDAEKTLADRTFTITWADIQPSPTL